jgi:hypothetical protein
VKYRGLLNQVRALRNRLPDRQGVVIRIEGGLPPGYAPAKPAPPGSDLKHQAAAFKAASKPKTAQRGS